MKTFDAVVVGGGVIGCSLARDLAGHGWKVAVIERGAKPGEESSWAAAGMLSPSAEAHEGSPLFELGRASLKLYRAFAKELSLETGIDPQYRSEGTLLLFESEMERQRILPAIEWQKSRGAAIEELSAKQVREHEPRLNGRTAGFYIADDHQIDNRLLVRALVESCRRRGVSLITGEAVQEVEHTGGKVNGVALPSERIAASRVINAAGAWAGSILVRELPPAPIRPVKGQMIALNPPAQVLTRVVRSHSVYLVPRSGGRVIVGSTMEDAGFDKTPRSGALARLLCAAQRLCPDLEESTIPEFWAGLRPAAPDSLPIIGPTALDGYWVALGHFRNGILLTPITTQIVSSWLLTGSPGFHADALLPQRFGM